MKMYSFSFIIGLMVLMIIYFTLVFVNVQVKADLVELRNERALLENEISLLRKYEELQNQVIFVNNTFNKIMAKIPDWEGMLVNVGLNIPEGVYLTDVTATQNTAGENPIGGDLLIRGYASNNALVASWLEEIRDISGINGANLSFVSKRTIDNQEVVQFEIKATVKPGEYDQPFSKGGQQ